MFADRIQSGLSQTRRIAVGAAIAALLGLTVAAEGSVANRLGSVALAGLVLAASSGWLQLTLQGRVDEKAAKPANGRISNLWFLAAIVIALTAALTVQTWIHPGSTIAGGDLVLPNGTGWLENLFEPWTWGGSTLGEPSELPLTVPWAAVLGFVRALGGDAEMAQRIWYTVLFVGCSLAAFSLLASLRMGPVASLTGAAVYLFNPYVITWVNTYDTYMVALFLLAAIPAVLIAASTGRISSRWAAVLIAATAPLIGYAFLNPPLVGMVLGVLLMTPVLVAWVDGREAAFRSVRALLFALPILVAASAYWVIPAVLHLATAIPTQFTDLSGWAWEEARATIRNAFWLNTHWGWNFPEYFPYAGTYDVPPLSIARFVLPAVAFAGLGLATTKNLHRARSLRLAVVSSSLALVVIVLSTGTNPPGNTLFIPLYKLPLGWLLREPARFLMLVGLAYAVLVAIVVDWSLKGKSVGDLLLSTRLAPSALQLAVAPAALGTSLLLGLPLYSGAFVADTKPTLASWAVSARPTHVQMPAYWTEMARLADASPIQGALLVMPPDDWYEMPYTWYYGTDAFVVQMFKRHVVLPSTTTYTPASTQLTTAVNLIGESILNRDWPQVGTLVTVLNTPLILVRGDIEAPYANHSILPPRDLATALEGAPNFVLIHRVGPLELFALRDPIKETEANLNFTMINTKSPDLRILPLLPMGTALVTGKPRQGESNVVQSPKVELWQDQGDSVVWRASAPPGWSYRIADLNSKAIVSLDHAGTFTASGPTHIEYAPSSPSQQISLSVKGRTAISDGDFAKGLWEPVQNCGAASSEPLGQQVAASVVNVAPGVLPALRLSAANAVACETKTIDWTGGSVLIDLMVRSVQGAAPRLCLWEVGRNVCAALPSTNDQSGWSEYRTSITPARGTTGLVLYLYADATVSGSRTVTEYANVRVLEMPSLPSFALLADPDPRVTSPLQLALVHNSYSNDWQGSTPGEHVLVDGLLNGWLIPTGSHTFTAGYARAGLFRAAEWVSLATLAFVLLIAGSKRIGVVVGQVRRIRRPI